MAWPASFAQRQNKKLPIVWEVLCGSSKLLEDMRDFVARFALCSFFSPQFCSSLARLNSWYILKPVVAFNRYLRPFGQSTAQWRMTDLLHDPCPRPKPENTNSRYSVGYFTTSNTSKSFFVHSVFATTGIFNSLARAISLFIPSEILSP